MHAQPSKNLRVQGWHPGGSSLTFVLLLAFVWLGPANAQVPEGDSWGYALAHELMSPYCPGRTLAACTSDQAAELRQWILLQEAAGASREEVMAILETRFGDVIRSSPEAEGWGLAAWLLPGATVLVGAVMVALILRRMVRRAPESPSAPPEAPGSRPDPAQLGDDELAQAVDRDIAAGDF